MTLFSYKWKRVVQQNESITAILPCLFNLKYLYRAVDSQGNTIEFMLSAKRNRKAVKRFSRKALKCFHTSKPRVINVDLNPACPAAVEELKAENLLPKGCKPRKNKYLNNTIEQDHRFIKRLVRPGLGFQSFHTASRALKGYEKMHMIRKGQVEGVGKGDIKNQIKFIEEMFGIAA